jgi:acetyltransferase-like isoleucine patch superfamily enzyme
MPLSIEQRFHRLFTQLPRTSARMRGRVYHLLMPRAFGSGMRIGPRLNLDNPAGLQLGRGVILHSDVMLLLRPPSPDRTPTLRVGAKTFLNRGAIVAVGQSVDIGADVMLGPYVCVVDEDHAFDDPRVAIARQGMTGRGPIVIGDGSWLATGAVVLGGSTIAPGSVVAAHAVVRGHFPERCVLAGAPAKVVKLLPADGTAATG